jgi:DNA-binding FrmR family transcriptional regulator
MSTIMTHALREKNKLLNRVRRVRGLLDAIERALDEEKGCPEVLHLIAAARGGISGLMGEVIEDHIREHVVEPAKPSERIEGGQELIEAIQSYLK